MLKQRLQITEKGAGEPLICLHSEMPGATSTSDFQRNIEALAARFRMVLVEMPSAPVDLSDSTRDVSQFNAGLVLEAMDALQLERASFLGVGLGASAACWIAARSPERVHKLVLVAPSGCAYSAFTPVPVEGMKAVANYWLDPSSKNLRTIVDLLLVDPQLRESTMECFQEHVAAEGAGLLREPAVSDLGPSDLTTVAPEISAPALLVWGREDKFSPRDYGLNLLARMKDAQFRMIPNAGHYCHVDKAEQFNAMALDFLTGE